MDTRKNCMKKSRNIQLICVCMALLALVGCTTGGQAESEPVHIIPFAELGTEGVADWNLEDEQTTMDEPETDETEEPAGNTGEYSIREDEMRSLVDANYKCVTNIFEVRLEGDWDAEGRIPVTDDAFANYADLEAYIREIYVKEEADYLLYRYSGGLPTYWEADGVFYMRDELCGGGPCFGCAWESYTIEEYTLDDNQCEFTVLAKYSEESAPENVAEENYYFTATYENGWKLDSMVCKAGKGTSGHEEAEKTVRIRESDLIGELEALQMAYDFYYGDSDLKEYSVYCEELPFLEAENLKFTQNMLGWTYTETLKPGYVVYQYADETGMTQEKYDPANPSPDKSKWILCSLGATNHRAYYVFWLYQYVAHGDGTYHLTTGDFCIVSYDGSVVVSERSDSMGNDINDPAAWNDLWAYLNISTPNQKAPVITEEQAKKLVDANYFCLTELFVYGQLEGEYLSWTEGGVARVCDERFPTYDDLEKYMNTYFRTYVAEALLSSMYYEENDIFYMRLTNTDPVYVPQEIAIPSFWTGYTIKEIKQSGTSCEIRVVPECEEELEVTTTYIMRAAYVNDEWKLEDMGWYLCLDELTLEEDEYTFHIKEVYNRDFNVKWNYIEGWVLEIYKDGELLQLIEQPNEEGVPSIENKIWYDDVNFDGKRDICLLWCYAGAQSANYYQCYLATEEGFELCESFDMFNPRIDADNRQIIGSHRGGAGYYELTYYQYDGNEFVLKKLEEYEWVYEAKEYKKTTFYY